MVAEFRGSPPHDLGTAVLALARALGENIEISLHLLNSWHRPPPRLSGLRWSLRWRARWRSV